MTWRTIDSAPRDGTWVLLYSAAETLEPYGAGWWDQVAGTWIMASLGGYEPTHWQPLPEPPASAEDGE